MAENKKKTPVSDKKSVSIAGSALQKKSNVSPKTVVRDKRIAVTERQVMPPTPPRPKGKAKE